MLDYMIKTLLNTFIENPHELLVETQHILKNAFLVLNLTSFILYIYNRTVALYKSLRKK